jgi:hypothetical protein
MASNISTLPLPKGNPQQAAKPALSNAERQKRWREKRNDLAKAAAEQPAQGDFGRQRWAAVAVAVVAVVLTGLSLAHLAAGIALVTKAPTWEAWSMAVGIDLGFIAMELAQLCAVSDAVRRDISRWSRPAILGTIVASAAMNALAFGAQADGWMIYPAVGLGVAVPALVYALSRVAFGLAASR